MSLERINKINSLDVFDKYKIYSNYLVCQLGLKHNFEVLDKNKKDWQHCGRTPDKEYGDLAFYYLWKNTPIKTFEEFISDKNIEVRDMGEDWQKNEFAQRYWVEVYGIYEWYLKFKNEFNFNLA